MTIYVKDYVTLPSDDAADAIRRAVYDAGKLGADEICFEAGIYNLRTPITLQRDMAADKEVLILIENMKNLTLRGKTDENGDPATILAGINTMEPNPILPSILWCEKCENLRVRDIAFTRAPEFASAGRVIGNDGKKLTVSVFGGCPCYDGMETYCMNRLTPDGKLDYASLSYGQGLGTKFSLVGDRVLELDSEKVASVVNLGELISWQQGAKTDFQCYFGHIQGLRLSNLRTYNANGFAMITFCCRDIIADRIIFRPRGNQLFCSPRDAWKIHKCGGSIEISRLYVEGVRMDGQNVHSNYLFVREVISERSLIAEADSPAGDFRVSGGIEGTIEFFSGEEFVGTAELVDSVPLGKRTVNGRDLHSFRLDLRDPIDFAVGADTLILPRCFMPESYHCRDSEFYNIAGAGHLLLISHLLIENCRYTYIMNPGIMLGAEFPIHHEGGNCEDAVIRGCEFRNCGFEARYSTVGCIGINSAGFHKAVNHDIRIENCRFADSDVGIDIHCARDVRISGCVYEGLDNDLRLE